VESGGEFEAQGTALVSNCGAKGGGVCNTELISREQAWLELIGKGEEARYQRGRAPHLFATCALQLFLGWQGGRAEQFEYPACGERVVDLVRGAAD